MTRNELDKIPRKTAVALLAGIPAGPGYDKRVDVAVEVAMNVEWWRGYYAGKSDAFEAARKVAEEARKDPPDKAVGLVAFDIANQINRLAIEASDAGS